MTTITITIPVNVNADKLKYLLQTYRAASRLVNEDIKVRSLIDITKNLSLKTETSSQPELLDIISNLANDELEKQNEGNPWNTSIFENINKLHANNSGRFGERFIKTLCDKLNISCSLSQKNATDGTYDLKINHKRVEIKTARLGKQGAFQHESLRNDGCDLYVFVDILPNELYITILPKFDLNEKCSIMERTPHCRKGTTNVFKIDWKENQLINSVKKGHSIKITKEVKDYMDIIKNFFDKYF
jgi:hypothetical protein